MRSGRTLSTFCAIVVALLTVLLCAGQSGSKRILVYTRNYTPDGPGYVHQNIAASVAALQRVGTQHGIAVDTSEDPESFTDDKLTRYDAVVFSNSNNEAFRTDAQREAFHRYIHAGHGFMAIHSAAGSERQWPYFHQVLGGLFAFHPAEQTFQVQVTDPGFFGRPVLPATFTRTDECYFLKDLSPGIHVLLTARRDALTLGNTADKAQDYPDTLPLAWTQKFDNSREFYLALGHESGDYTDPLFTRLLTSGLLWTLGMEH